MSPPRPAPGWGSGWAQLVDRALPDGAAGGDLLWRARTFLAVLSALTLSFPLFALLNLLAGRPGGAVVTLVLIAQPALMVGVIRWARSPVPAAHLLGLMGTVTMVAIAHGLEGGESGALMWLGALVLIITIGGGARVGFAWAGVGIVAIWGVYVLSPHETANAMSSGLSPAFEGAVNVSVFTLFAALAAWLWDSARRTAQHEAFIAAERVRDAERKALLAERLATTGTLATGVAHELNTPITYLSMNLELLAERLKGDEETSTMLAEARHGARRIRDIVAQIKTFARADEAKVRPFAVVDAMNAALRMVGNQVRLLARVEVDVDPAVRVVGNESRLAQVFLNLLQNACDAMPEGQGNAIVVRGFLAGGQVQVDVSDNGPGIAPALIDRVFDPFFTTKPVGQGMGLGLSICQSIVLDAGRTLKASSQVGRGTTFTLLLPACVDDPLPSMPQRAPLERDRQRMRVLVIDDDPLLGRAMRRALRDRHSLVVVSSAEDALAQLVSGADFDAIVCDLMMPGMPGWVFAERLRDVRPDLAPYTLFVSGGAFTHAARAFVDRASAQFLAKPYSADELADALERLPAIGEGVI